MGLPWRRCRELRPLWRWTLLTLAFAALPTAAIKVVAPEKCGATRVIPHQSANFGPALGETDQQYEVFVPMPQREGEYVSDNPEGLSSVNRRDDPDPSLTKSLFDGCKELSVTGDIEQAESKVVIVARGGCDFVDKVINMQKHGAVGVVVVNTGERDAQQMSAPKNAPDVVIEIPEVMISAREWGKIAECRDNLTIVLTSNGQAQYDLDFANKSTFTVAMMRGMALWILFQCGVNMFRYKRRHSELSARADAISRLPVCRYSRRAGQTSTTETPFGDRVDWDDEPICTICLEGFDEGDCIRVLACQHMFHQTCLDPWLAQSSSCPVCKRDIPDLPPPSSHLHQYGAFAAV